VVLALLAASMESCKDSAAQEVPLAALAVLEPEEPEI